MQSLPILSSRSDKPPTKSWWKLAFSNFNRIFMIALLSVSGAALFLIDYTVALAQDGPIEIDFEGLPIETSITEFTVDGLTVNIVATGGLNEAWTFDSSNPTGGDEDLGTPNEGCPGGGPGQGTGGAPGTSGENCVSLGNVLIIQEEDDGDQNGRPDDNANGGTLEFTFSEPIIVNYFDLLDFEGPGGGFDAEDNVSISFFAEDGSQLGGAISPQGFGDNSYERLFPASVGATEGIARIFMELPISGAIGGMQLLRASTIGSIGDLLTCADDGSPLGGVTVNLTNIDTNESATTTTDTSGLYLFDNLPLGNFKVTVDVSTITGTCNIPNSDPAGDTDGATDGMSNVSLTDAVWDNLDQDFTFTAPDVPLGSVGDTLTCIDDGSPLGDVTVTLTNLSDNSTETATTNAQGQYLFDSLPLGEYKITVDPATITGSCNIPDSDPASDTDGATDGMANVTLTDAAPDRLDQDFTFTEPAPILGSIGDTLTCVDDGSPLAGVTVTLTDLSDNSTTTVTTNAQGQYLFDSLPLGDYKVTVDPATITGSCNIPDSDPASDNDGATDGMANVTLTDAAPNRLDQDFTFTQPPPILGSIGDTIFCDANGNDIPDPGEGSPNVIVSITDSSGTSISDTTDASGLYGFTDLPLGIYIVTVDVTSLPETCNVPSVDPDGAESNASTAELTEAEPNDPEQDFGYVAPEPELGSIGDTIFCDANGNNAPDPTEGLGGVDVTLSGDADGPQTTTTGPNGTYLFTNLAAGDYQVAVDTADLPIDCNVPSVDPDDGPMGQSTVPLAAGEDNLDQDFGYVAPDPELGSIGDTIFCDTNNDGILDAGDERLQNVNVSLAGPSTDSQTTDADGTYLFDNLPAGDYTVTVDNSTLPTSCNVAKIDPDGGTNNASSVQLGDGEDNLDQDFGYEQTACVGDRVWLDADVDGVQDEGETGVSSAVNVVVSPSDNPGAIVGSMQTNANGDYQFCGLPAGDYTVRVVPGSLPEGIVQNFELDGSVDGEVTVSLSAGDNREDVDFGYHTPVDLTLSKTASVTETGPNQPFSFSIVVENQSSTLATGVEVTDQLPNGLDFSQASASTGVYTAATGIWAIGNIAGGQSVTLTISVVSTGNGPYTNVAEITETDQEDIDSTPGDNEPSEDDQEQVTVTGGAPSVAIGNYVWIDANSDGLQGADELGLPGVTVTLFNSADAEVDSTTTNSQGEYRFDNLPPGSYSVQFSPPSDFGFTTPNAGDDGLDSDADPANDNKTAPVDVQEGENMTIDAGFVAVVLSPELTVQKVAVQGQVIRGGAIIYDIQYANIGDGLAEDVQIVEGIPSGTSFNASESSAGWRCTGATCIFDAGDLAAGATGPVVKFALTVDEDLPATVTRIDCAVSVTTSSTTQPGPQSSTSVPVDVVVPTDVDPSVEPERIFYYYLPLLQ